MTQGGCLCGAVRFEVRGKILGAWFCHCSRCRRSTGSAFPAGAVCALSDLFWRSGEDRIGEYRASSGYRRRFCVVCASPVPLHPEGTDLAWLPLGCLDDPDVRPTHHIFVGSKAPWFDIGDALPQFDEQAPRPSG